MRSGASHSRSASVSGRRSKVGLLAWWLAWQNHSGRYPVAARNGPSPKTVVAHLTADGHPLAAVPDRHRRSRASYAHQPVASGPSRPNANPSGMHSVQRGMAAVTFRKRSRNLDSRPEEARVRLDRVWPGVTPLLELSFGRELKVARKSHFFLAATGSSSNDQRRFNGSWRTTAFGEVRADPYWRCSQGR